MKPQVRKLSSDLDASLILALTDLVAIDQMLESRGTSDGNPTNETIQDITPIPTLKVRSLNGKLNTGED